MNFMQSSIDKWIPSKTAPAADSPDTDTNDTDDTVETDKMETETEIEAVKLSRFPFGETSLDFLSVLCQYLSPLDILALKAASSSLRRVMQGSIFLDPLGPWMRAYFIQHCHSSRYACSHSLRAARQCVLAGQRVSLTLTNIAVLGQGRCAQCKKYLVRAMSGLGVAAHDACVKTHISNSYHYSHILPPDYADRVPVEQLPAYRTSTRQHYSYNALWTQPCALLPDTWTYEVQFAAEIAAQAERLRGAAVDKERVRGEKRAAKRTKREDKRAQRVESVLRRVPQAQLGDARLLADELMDPCRQAERTELFGDFLDSTTQRVSTSMTGARVQLLRLTEGPPSVSAPPSSVYPASSSSASVSAPPSSVYPASSSSSSSTDNGMRRALSLS